MTLALLIVALPVSCLYHILACVRPEVGVVFPEKAWFVPEVGVVIIVDVDVVYRTSSVARKPLKRLLSTCIDKPSFFSITFEGVVQLILCQ